MLRAGQDGEPFVVEKLAGFADLDAEDQKKVTERLADAAENKGEVDAANKLARAEAKAEEKAALAERAAKITAKLEAKRLAAKAAKKGQLTVSSAGSSSPAKQPIAAMSFFGAKAATSKSAELAKEAAKVSPLRNPLRCV